MALIKNIKIVIEHMDCAAWITTNNTYTWDGKAGTWDSNVNLWQGVLFQFGDYQSMTGSRLVAFDGVKLMKRSTEVLKLTRADFESGNVYWINVVAKKAESGRVDPPMDPDQLKDLLIDDTSNSPIRNFFTPFPGGMTFWHGKKGYTLTTTQDVHHNQHDRYVFKFPRSTGGYVSVHVNDIATTYKLGSDVTRIVVIANPKALITHGDQNNPPQYPPA